VTLRALTPGSPGPTVHLQALDEGREVHLLAITGSVE
jgi:hypothetical protein